MPSMNKIIILLALVSVFSCATWRRFRSLRDAKTIAAREATAGHIDALAPEKAGYRLERDIRRLQTFSAELQALAGEMAGLQGSVGLKKRGYFTPEEHDAIENLLFRYLAYRASLWDMVDYYKEYRLLFADPDRQVRGFVLGFDAALHLAFYTSKLVDAFIDEPVVKQKLNEKYFRSRIPAGTYDSLYASITNLEHVQAIEAAWLLFANELGDTAAGLYRLNKNDPVYRGLIGQIQSLYRHSQVRIRHILSCDALLLPRTESMLSHSAIAELARAYFKEWEDNLEATRALVYTQVGDWKLAGSYPIAFTPDQARRIRETLRPGDVLLTYTAGFMSNIFLPGRFKHGITYIGTASQRRTLGLTPDALPGLPAVQREKLAALLPTDTLPDGQTADVIESVSEGVIFNSLDEILGTHVNRLLALRPRVDAGQLVQGLAATFLLVGNQYDFRFDFTDGSQACCTEVIYQALNGRGAIAFPLTRRLGVQTLSADDIALYHLKTNPRAFEFVLYAEEAPRSPTHQARVWYGSEGQERLERVMAQAE